MSSQQGSTQGSIDMGSGVEASTAAPSPGRAPQPAFGQYVDHSEFERDKPGAEECAADRFARRIQWPALAFLAVLETVWLLGLGYLAQLLIG
jgi:hypothetical protein